jgi:hypothetical protein
MSQNQQIADYLRAGNALTPGDALRLFGSARLAARIGELKNAGMEIESTMIEVTGPRGVARVARYVLKREAVCE